MDKNRITFLFEKALRNEIAPQEREELFRLLQEKNQEDQIDELFEQARRTFEHKKFFFTQSESEMMVHHLMDEIGMVHRKKKKKYYYQWAAVAMLVLSIGSYFYLTPLQNDLLYGTHTEKQTIEPGSDKATLKLANGKVLNLAGNESKIADIDGVTIIKNEQGQLVYQINTEEFPPGAEVKENVLTTPKGGQFQLILPDGTKAWLSAASSLQYPTRFIGESRTVTLKGEAYFEVAKNQSMPFQVKAGEAIIHVLGTDFLVNAYDDAGETRTTLFEGKVSIAVNSNDPRNAENQKILKPGQQATFNHTTNNITVRQVDIQDALALKNGYFVFQGDNIQTVMKTISRWYDVEVVYDGDVSGETFIGTVSKFDTIDKLLRTIELTGGVHFKIEGRKVLVKK